MQRQDTLLWPELASEGVPLELSLHLEFLVENGHLSLRRDGLDLGVDPLVAPFPQNHHVLRFAHREEGLANIEVDGDFLLVGLIHFE